MTRNVIYKTLNILFQYFVQKAGLPPGTRRQRKDGIYVKQPDGTWLKETGQKQEKPEEQISYEEKIKKWQEISDKWEGQENIGFRAVQNLENIMKPSIDIFDENQIREAGNAYGLTYDEDYNELPYEELKEKVLEKILEKYQENGLDVTYEEMEDGSIKFTYPGVNTTESFNADLQGSYNYFVVLKGNTVGYNYFDDTPVKSVTDIKAIYDSNGNEININKEE